MTSKYDRLADHLAALGAPVITLTFAEVEAVLGPLPATARHTPELPCPSQSGPQSPKVDPESARER